MIPELYPALILILSGALLGSGITLAIVRNRTRRIEAESWQAARRFYIRINSDA